MENTFERGKNEEKSNRTDLWEAKVNIVISAHREIGTGTNNNHSMTHLTAAK